MIPDRDRSAGDFPPKNVRNTVMGDAHPKPRIANFGETHPDLPPTKVTGLAEVYFLQNPFSFRCEETRNDGVFQQARQQPRGLKALPHGVDILGTERPLVSVAP